MADHFEEQTTPNLESASSNPDERPSEIAAPTNSDERHSYEPEGSIIRPTPTAYSSSSDPYGSTPESSPEPTGAGATSVGATRVGLASPEPTQDEPIAEMAPKTSVAVASNGSPPASPPPPPPDDEDDEGDEEEKGMLRMSFMDHLEELRSRLLRALAGVVVAFLVSISFASPLWRVVSAPAINALKHLHVNPPKLTVITPMEGFNIIYLKLPLLISVFLGSPWILYQVWAFISPGLYKREKRWAVPFILCTAGLFITGGLFAYFVAFRYGLEFLLGIGRDANVTPMVSINEYFDLFVNVTLGVGLVFEMPVLIFFLTLLRLASPSFLLRHSRYAILAITIIAAVVTPTPDVFNMMIFATPMVLLFFVGVFASHLLVLKREGKSFPWRAIALVVLGMIVIVANLIALLIYRYHYHFIYKWPYFTK